MKKDQKGTILPIVIVTIVVALILGAGLLVYSRSGKNEEPATSQNSKKEDANKTTNNNTEIIELETPLYIADVVDVNELPDETPDSFKTYLINKIAEGYDCDGTIYSYAIARVSQDFISGSAGCEGYGGVGVIWYKDGESWGRLSSQSLPDCDDVIAANIPTEFMESCRDGENGMVDNPVGPYSKN